MKKHPLDVLSLVFGLVFVLIAGTWVVRRTVDIDLPDMGWFLAGALILAGLLGIVSVLRGTRNAAVDSSNGGADTEPPAQE
jgi:hypothetical protein